VNLADEIQIIILLPANSFAVVIGFFPFMTINIVAVPFRDCRACRRACAKLRAKFKLPVLPEKKTERLSCTHVVLIIVEVGTKFQRRVCFDGVRNLIRVARFVNHMAVFEIFRYVNGLARFRRRPHALVVKFRAVHNLVCRDHEVRKTCRFKRDFVADDRGFKFFHDVAFDVISDVFVRLKRLRHGDFDLAARLHLFATLCESDVKNGNPCAVVRLVDCRNCSPSFLAFGCVGFCFKFGAALKSPACRNAAFCGQFVDGGRGIVTATALIPARDKYHAQNKNKDKRNKF